MLGEEVAELADMLFEAAISHVASVSRHFRDWHRIGLAAFVGVAEDELACLQRAAAARIWYVLGAFDHRLRKAVTVAEMVVRVAEGRRRLELEAGDHLDSGAAGQQPLMLHLAAAAFRCIASEKDGDGMKVVAVRSVD